MLPHTNVSKLLLNIQRRPKDQYSQGPIGQEIKNQYINQFLVFGH